MSFSSKRLPLLTAFAFLAEILLLAPVASALDTLRAGMQAPDFSVRTITGETKSYADVKGAKLTVLVFWSTYDANSKQALTRLQKLYGKYKDQGLAIIGINVDGQQVTAQTIADIKTFQSKLRIGFPMLVDHGLVTFCNYGVIALPTTVIMDKARMIAYELPAYPLVGAEEMLDFIVATFERK